MANFNITVEGADKLEKALISLEPKIARKLVRRTLRNAAKPILALAKSLVPVRTGRLKKSLKIRAAKRRKGRYGVRIQTGTRDELGIDEKTPYYYPAAVEYGTNTSPAQSFMRAALDSKKQAAKSIIEKDLRESIREANK